MMTLGNEIGCFFCCHKCFACCLSISGDGNFIYINTDGILVIFHLLQPLRTQMLISTEMNFVQMTFSSKARIYLFLGLGGFESQRLQLHIFEALTAWTDKLVKIQFFGDFRVADIRNLGEIFRNFHP